MVNILIISGSSGSGKSTLARELARRIPETFEVVRSITTRPPREENEYYSFVSKGEFLRLEKSGILLESNNYSGNCHLYGTPENRVRQIISNGKIAILDIDVNGRDQIIEKNAPEYHVLSAFILVPPTILYDRLIKRGETHDSAIKRIRASLYELEKCITYDIFIINDNFNKALQDLTAQTTGKCTRNSIDIDTYLQETISFLAEKEAISKRY